MTNSNTPTSSDTWMGTCEACGSSYDIDDATLRAMYPQLAAVFAEGEFEATCGDCHLAPVTLRRVVVKAVPFSAWNILPAATGCPDCGTEHDPELPHDQTSLAYQYRFRSGEAKAGREERWPTWLDAMAHCSPSVRETWIQALTNQGIALA